MEASLFVYGKEYNNFPTLSAEFSNQTFFFPKVASAALCSLITYTKIGQSQSLLEFVKLYLLANETTAVNQKLDFRQAFSFEWLSREERCLQQIVQSGSKGFLSRGTGSTVAHQNVQFSNGSCEAKSSKLAEVKCRAILEGATVISPSSHLQQDCRPELASKLKRLDCSYWFSLLVVQKRISERAFN